MKFTSPFTGRKKIKVGGSFNTLIKIKFVLARPLYQTLSFGGGLIIFASFNLKQVSFMVSLVFNVDPSLDSSIN